MMAAKRFEDYEVNPVCALFPMMDRGSQEFGELSASIERNGLWESIVLDSEGRILDGRNRLAACIECEIEPQFVNFADLNLGNNEDGEPVQEEEYAFSRNAGRRQLTEDQKVVVFAKFGEYLRLAEEAKYLGGKKGGQIAGKGRAKADDRDATKSSHPYSEPKKRAADTRTKLANDAGVSQYKAQQALDVERKAPALAEKVGRKEISLSAAHKAMKHGIDAAILAPLPSREVVEAFVDEVVRLNIPSERHAEAADFVVNNKLPPREIFKLFEGWWSSRSGEAMRRENERLQVRKRERERKARAKMMNPIHMAFLDTTRQLRGLLPKLEGFAQNSEHIPPHIVDNESDTIHRVISALGTIREKGARRAEKDVTPEQQRTSGAKVIAYAQAERDRKPEVANAGGADEYH